VVVTDGNEIIISERPVTRDELISRITLASRNEQSLLIKADKQADLGKVIEVWDICRQYDIKRISIATTQ
jgi:biopolymer transport protein ExbD